MGKFCHYPYLNLLPSSLRWHAFAMLDSDGVGRVYSVVIDGGVYDTGLNTNACVLYGILVCPTRDTSQGFACTKAAMNHLAPKQTAACSPPIIQLLAPTG